MLFNKRHLVNVITYNSYISLHYTYLELVR